MVDFHRVESTSQQQAAPTRPPDHPHATLPAFPVHTQESLRQTARDAGDVLAAAPQAAASAASTAAEIAGGVVEHVTGRSKEVGMCGASAQAGRPTQHLVVCCVQLLHGLGFLLAQSLA
jgi:hypothetical protein